MEKELRIKLNNTLTEKALKDVLRAKDIISYLLLFNEFKTAHNTTEKEIDTISLKDIYYIRKNSTTKYIITKAYIDTTDNTILLTLSNEIEENKINIIKEIEENRIKIYSSDTIYSSAKLQYINIKALEKIYKNIIRVAKEKGVKIAYKNSTKKQIDTLKKEYIKAYEEYKTLFNNLCAAWKKMENLYIGFTNTEEYKVLSDIDRQLQRLNYRAEGNYYSQAIDLDYHLKDLYNTILNDGGVIKITL